jgi:hypothetical protein
MMKYSEHERQRLTIKIAEEIKGLTPEKMEFLLGIIEEEYNSGFDGGTDVYRSEYESGYDYGYNCGYDCGYSEGHNDGYDCGYSEGHNDGYYDVKESNE